jgi:hypothetical protein
MPGLKPPYSSQGYTISEMSYSKETYGKYFGTEASTLMDESTAHPTTVTESNSLGAAAVPSNRETSGRVYHIKITTFRSHYNVYNANNEQLYHFHTSTWTPKKPSLTVHAGTSKEAPVVAVCKFWKGSWHLTIELGNPETPKSVKREDVICINHLHQRYRFRLSFHSEKRADRQPFLWKGTRKVEIGGRRFFSESNKKLVDEATGRIVALFTPGLLEIYADYGPKFELMVIVTAVGLYEKNAREDFERHPGWTVQPEEADRLPI